MVRSNSVKGIDGFFSLFFYAGGEKHIKQCPSIKGLYTPKCIMLKVRDHRPDIEAKFSVTDGHPTGLKRPINDSVQDYSLFRFAPEYG